MATRASLTVVSGGIATSAWANGIRDHIVPYSGAADGTTEGMVSVDTATDQPRIGNGSTTVQFGCYGTPASWSLAGSGTQVVQGGGGGNAAISNNLMVRYGRHVRASGLITMSVASGFAGNPIYVRTQLPVPATTVVAGTFLFTDVSAGNRFYEGSAQLTGSGDIFMYTTDSVGAGLGASPSVELQVNDTIWFVLDYFAASAT